MLICNKIACEIKELFDYWVDDVAINS